MTREGVLRIGNASGFYGDRFDALREMLTGGPLDVLTGDYLAELTMLILGRDRLKDARRGYARTFLHQLETALGLAVDRGVRLVVNAGGLNPRGLAEAVAELGDRLGVAVRVGHVEGDDVSARDWGEGVLTANAYLGGAGIAECLRADADVVVTGRVTDAALVTGAAAAHFGWREPEASSWDEASTAELARYLDAMAGAVVVGHLLECGPQVTGGNYAFFEEAYGARRGVDPRLPGFPLAEISADGTAVVTKHPGTGGAVTLGTVTSQLLYETAGARYLGPDVTARLDTVHLEEDGPDRVRVFGVRGEPPPPQLKVGLTRWGGHRNEVVFVLTGLAIEEKAALIRTQMDAALDERPPAERTWTLARTDHANAPVQEEASALLRLVVRDPDAETVGRPVSGAAVELALASIPGFHVTAPPSKGAPYGIFETAYTPADGVPHTAVLPANGAGGERRHLAPPRVTRPANPLPEPELPAPLVANSPRRRAALGTLVGARSGDKGGSANVGVWARDGNGEVWRWMAHELTVERLHELLPETAELPVVRHVLPNLRALNFVVEGLLGAGVASQARFDPQAKALGEWLRSRRLDVPEVLLEQFERRSE